MRVVVLALVCVGCATQPRPRPAVAPALSRAIEPAEEPARLSAETCASEVTRGNAADGEGRLDEARAAYERALALDRRCVAAHVNLARLDRRADPRSASAESHLARALEMSADSIDALDQLVLLHLDRGELDLADRAIDRTLAVAPGHVAGHHARGIVAVRRGDVHAALAAFERAIEIEPTFESCMERGALHLALGQPEAGERDHRMAIALRPTSYDAWLALGRGLGGSAREVEARAALERAARIDPRRPEAYWELALAIVRTARTAREGIDAVVLFREFVVRARGNPAFAAQVESVEAECGCETVEGRCEPPRRRPGTRCAPGWVELFECTVEITPSRECVLYGAELDRADP